MIGTSSMVIFDLIVIGLVLFTIVVAVFQGVLKKGHTPRVGGLVMLSGLVIAGLFCVVDVLFLFSERDPELGQQAAAGLDVLHRDLRWVGALLTLSLIGTGFSIFAFERRRVVEAIAQAKDLAKSVRDSAVRTESHLGTMLKQATDPIYCFEFRPPIPVDLPIEEQVARSIGAILVECNLAFAISVGKKSREEALGMRFGDMHTIMSPESHAKFHRRFVENGYELTNYHFSFRDPDGRSQLLLINVTGDVENDVLVRLWGSDKNILQQSKRDESLKRRLKFGEFTKRISTRLLLAQSEGLEKALNACLKDVGAYLRVDRISIVWLHQESKTVRLRYFWNEAGEKLWDEAPLDNFPMITSRILRGIPVTVDSMGELAREFDIDAKNLQVHGLKSIAALPLIVEGEIYGVFTLSNVHDEREWTHHDLADLKVLADLFANVVFRINSYKALSDALTELRSMKIRLEAENIYLRQEITQSHGFDELIGQSDRLRHCLHQVQQVAATGTTVLVQGETGTGKELVVRAIHELSKRNHRTLVKINCAALPADLIESELFGHEKGAFTGAGSRKQGRFDLADGGTLFLDEIGDFPLELQGKLLRVLQEGEFQRVGGNETHKVDVRLIAATNRELQIAVDSGQFRADLYYRINVYPITLPPLRERKGDVPLLAEHFVHKHSAGLGKNITAISALMMEQLEAYSWPGNVRELESVIQRSLISANGPTLQLAEVLGNRLGSPESPDGLDGLPLDLFAAEKTHIVRVLNQAGWVVAGGGGAADKLGVPPSTLRSKMKKLGIRRPS